MATPSVVQTSDWQLDNASNVGVLSLTGVTTGNTLVVLISLHAGADRTFTVVDQGGSPVTFTQRARGNDSIVVEIWDAINVPAGDYTVHLTPSGGANFYSQLVEIQDVTAFDVSSARINVPTLFHACAAGTGLDTSAPVLVFGVVALSASGGTLSTAFTEIGTHPTATNQTFAHYTQLPDGGEGLQLKVNSTSERGSVGAISSYLGAAAAGLSIPIAAYHYRHHLRH